VRAGIVAHEVEYQWVWREWIEGREDAPDGVGSGAGA
jgi:hypothetical protein